MNQEGKKEERNKRREEKKHREQRKKRKGIREVKRRNTVNQ